MAQTTLIFKHWIENVETDATSVVLADPTDTYGVKRTDTDAVVVASGTPMTRVALGTYEHTFTDPALDITYDYWVRRVFNSVTSDWNFSATSGVAVTGNLYDGLLPRTLSRAGDVPDVFVKQRLRAVFREFCRRTGIWQEKLATFVTVADQSEYTLTTPYDAEFIRVRRVEVGDLTPDDPNTKGSQKRFQFSEESVLAIWPTPAVAGDNVVVWVTLLPNETITQVPAWMITRWGDAVVNGLVADLKLMTDVPWTDLDGGVKAMANYTSDISRAKRETTTNRGSTVLRVAIPQFV